MKIYKILLLALFVLPISVFSQEEVKEEKPERPAFESSFIIDNPTNVLFSKNTLEVTMQHRFGIINGGENDMAGFWAPSNIRIGLTYAVHDKITIGYGTTKDDRLQDMSLKVGLLQQTRSDKMPFSVTYYGNMVINAKKKENFIQTQDRYSYFHQLIIARRFSPNVSFQIAPSISHFNAVDSFMENDRISIAFGGRAKISPNTSILLDYSQPITQFGDDPNKPDVDFNLPGVSLGLEFGTSAHAFQIFVSNLSGIVPQQNYFKNQNDFFDGDVLIGFNITRNYNF